MPAVSESKYLVQCGWGQVPHLTAKQKRQQLENSLPHLIEPRSTGNPSLAAGAIYPMKKERFMVEPFEIPGFWRRAYGLDVGWNMTAALWGALDGASDTLYIYTEHYEGHALPSVHAESINARGKWIPGVIDPAANLSNLRDGEALLAEYLSLGLNLTKAINSVDAGILAVWKRMYTGRLKVFSSCTNFLAEHALYRRDEHGKIVKKNDHLMDAGRYLIISGLSIATTAPIKTTEDAGGASSHASGY